MITKLTIENYKSYYQKTSIPFSSLTLISGANSSGKSSILESIILFSQINSHDPLNGKNLSLGSFNQIFNNTKKLDSASINFEISTAEKNYNYKIVNNVGNEANFDAKDNIVNSIFYLSADRVGVLDIYEKNRNEHFLDPKGSFLINLLFDKKDSLNLGRKYLAYFPKNQDEKKYGIELPLYTGGLLVPQSENYFQESTTLLNVLNAWLKLMTGYTVTIKENSNQKFLEIIYLKDNKEYNPQHVGTGVTFILHQLIAVLGSEDDSIILIENPEIHLHPKVQSVLSYFFLWASKIGKQIIIESHSDHFYNSFRLFKSRKEECKILFCWLNDIGTEVEEIMIGTYGEVKNNKEGLFDQFLNDLDQMLVPVNERV